MRSSAMIAENAGGTGLSHFILISNISLSEEVKYAAGRK